MNHKDKEQKQEMQESCVPLEEEQQETPAEEVTGAEVSDPETQYKETLAKQEEKYLRLAAEYDNFRKRSQKEKESTWNEARADAILAFLPVYDNLERAVKQGTADEAYAKGVEMTMTGLKEILKKLGVEEIEAVGQRFDPNLHNAVMHVEDEETQAGVIVEVFQSGFKLGGKVIRVSMVKVAN